MINKAKLITGKILCFLGFHSWRYIPERSKYSWRVNMSCKRKCDARSHTIKNDVIGRRIWG